MVEEKKYPWELRDWKDNIRPQRSQTVEIPKFKSDFLKASSLKEPEIIPAASTRKQKDESYIPEYEIEKVMND